MYECVRSLSPSSHLRFCALSCLILFSFAAHDDDDEGDSDDDDEGDCDDDDDDDEEDDDGDDGTNASFWLCKNPRTNPNARSRLLIFC